MLHCGTLCSTTSWLCVVWFGYHAFHAWLLGFNPVGVVLRGLVTTHIMRGYVGLTTSWLCGVAKRTKNVTYLFIFVAFKALWHNYRQNYQS